MSESTDPTERNEITDDIAEFDSFLTKTKCDRCPNTLDVRTMSWFTKEVICMDCSDIEDDIKQQLRDRGFERALEGCGYVPTIKNTP